ncbi:hypothetical protein [Catellatospora chokoriensis]|uniref:Polyketide cyclase / dehydrase and lipid transport n=1 Tax=Catellatospora chokoriensis TaxID=310353 RepID=A0A8J3NVV0_9ACTN|nr:hypothetical protein [Catellatospora chokoriensis]GIF94333.1 hypothetical protein Cch02nite_77770 [Catellatospora chokoriensis]
MNVVVAMVSLAAGIMLAARARAFRPPVRGVTFDGAALALLGEAAAGGPLRLIATEPTLRDPDPGCRTTTAPAGRDEAIFLEVAGGWAGRGPYQVTGEHYCGYRILTVKGDATGRTVAAVLLGIRDATGHVPSVDFSWPMHGHARHVLRFLLTGAGQLAPAAREVLRRAEPDAARRPTVHIGP